VRERGGAVARRLAAAVPAPAEPHGRRARRAPAARRDRGARRRRGRATLPGPGRLALRRRRARGGGERLGGRTVPGPAPLLRVRAAPEPPVVVGPRLRVAPRRLPHVGDLPHRARGRVGDGYGISGGHWRRRIFPRHPCAGRALLVRGLLRGAGQPGLPVDEPRGGPQLPRPRAAGRDPARLDPLLLVLWPAPRLQPERDRPQHAQHRPGRPDAGPRIRPDRRARHTHRPPRHLELFPGQRLRPPRQRSRPHGCHLPDGQTGRPRPPDRRPLRPRRRPPHPGGDSPGPRPDLPPRPPPHRQTRPPHPPRRTSNPL
ncbi:MAG: CAAX amino terminal protease family protein, partial [uncultured Rubrobacteraceae bacterium]